MWSLAKGIEDMIEANFFVTKNHQNLIQRNLNKSFSLD